MSKSLKAYTVNFKAKVIAFADKNGPSKASKEYNIPPRTIFKWRKSSKEISELSKMQPKRLKLEGGGRKKLFNLEEDLLNWFYDMQHGI